MKVHYLGLIILFAALHAPILRAQESPSAAPWSLQQCIDTGLRHNLDINRARNTVQRFATFRTVAYGDFLPGISASATWLRSDQSQIRIRPDGLIQSRDSWSYGIEAGVTLFNGMRNINAVDKSLLDFEAAQESAKRMSQQIVYYVQEGFFNVLRLKQLTQVQEANVERSNKQLELIRELNAVGSVPLADLYKQEVQVGVDRLALLDARNAFRNALLDMQALLGLQPRADFTLADEKAESEITRADIDAWRLDIGDLNALMQEALLSRADYRETELSMQSAEKEVSIAKAGHSPVFSAFAQYNWSNLELKDFTVYDRFSYGLNLSIPIFSRFQVSTAVQRSNIQLREIEQIREQVRKSIATEIMKALNDLESAELNIEIAASRLLSAREDHRAASERYNIGAATILDLITAAAGLQMAESDVINARFNYLTAQQRLEYHLGRTRH
jgi:outer membrane protein